MLNAATVDAGPSLDSRVTVNVKDSTLSAFLDAISEQAHVNFTLDEGVADRRVTAFLKNVTAKEALEIVLTIKGLSCRRLKGPEAYAIGPAAVR